MCMIDGGDPPKVYHSKTRTARKERKCDECSRTIMKGEPYLYASMLYDDYWSSFSVCQHCQTPAQWLTDNCGGYAHAGILEDINEHRMEYRELRYSMLRLEIGMRRQWKRFDGAGLMAIPLVPETLEERGLGHD